MAAGAGGGDAGERVRFSVEINFLNMIKGATVGETPRIAIPEMPAPSIELPRLSNRPQPPARQANLIVLLLQAATDPAEDRTSHGFVAGARPNAHLGEVVGHPADADP